MRTGQEGRLYKHSGTAVCEMQQIQTSRFPQWPEYLG